MVDHDKHPRRAARAGQAPAKPALKSEADGETRLAAKSEAKPEERVAKALARAGVA